MIVIALGLASRAEAQLAFPSCVRSRGCPGDAVCVVLEAGDLEGFCVLPGEGCAFPTEGIPLSTPYVDCFGGGSFSDGDCDGDFVPNGREASLAEVCDGGLVATWAAGAETPELVSGRSLRARGSGAIAIAPAGTGAFSLEPSAFAIGCHAHRGCPALHIAGAIVSGRCVLFRDDVGACLYPSMAIVGTDADLSCVDGPHRRSDCLRGPAAAAVSYPWWAGGNCDPGADGATNETDSEVCSAAPGDAGVVDPMRDAGVVLDATVAPDDAGAALDDAGASPLDAAATTDSGLNVREDAASDEDAASPWDAGAVEPRDGSTEHEVDATAPLLDAGPPPRFGGSGCECRASLPSSRARGEPMLALGLLALLLGRSRRRR